VVINCPALPDSLVETELFGVERGVATGVDARPGRLVEAEGGTVLLDEIGDLSLAAQAKLLRFLQDGCVDRPGRSAPLAANVRVLAATNADLPAQIKANRFRGDLYHRLAGFSIHLPALRERIEDLPGLVQHFLARSGARISSAALGVLGDYSFPGNVRELELLLRQAAILAGDREIGVGDLPERVRSGAGLTPGALTPTTPPAVAPDLYRRIVREGESFWDLVFIPYRRRELRREELLELLRQAEAEVGGSLKAIARHLRVEAEYRKFVDFLRNHKLRP
jgi:DNA-binding NtrC family response regulator